MPKAARGPPWVATLDTIALDWVIGYKIQFKIENVGSRFPGFMRGKRAFSLLTSHYVRYGPHNWHCFFARILSMG
jgi:hypothetical protein